MSTQWEGVFATVTTPFAEDEALDLAALESQVARLVDRGAGGVVVLGPLGEGESLTARERGAVVRCSVRAVDGRAPLLVAVAETTTRAACQFAVECERAGAGGLLLLPSPLYASDARETLMHCRSVAAAVELPVLAGAGAAVDTAAAVLGEDLGDGDEQALQAALLGARGHLSALATVCPDEVVERWRLAAARRFEEAAALHRRLEPLRRAIAGPKAVQALKLAQQVAGLGGETARAPRLALGAAERERLARLVLDARAGLAAA